MFVVLVGGGETTFTAELGLGLLLCFGRPVPATCAQDAISKCDRLVFVHMGMFPL